MKSSQKHTLPQLEALCSKIISIKDTGKSQRIDQQLQQMCKLLVWGDRYDSDFFQHFFQIKALDRLLEIFSKTNSKQLVIAIISFFSNLISNITKIQNITYLLSHPCLLSLQNIKFFALDNEIAEYYINFLNTLSQKIDPQTLHLFFNRRYPTFPLLMQTTRFYNHPQNLVRTKCRSILLSCLRIENERVRKFGVGFPFVTYYLHQCCLLRQYWEIVNQVMEMDGDKQFQLNNLEGLFQDQKELIMILDDFMKIDPTNIANCLINAFANECISPLLQDLASTSKPHFQLKVVIHLLSTLISNIHNKQFIDFLIFCLFSKYYTSTILVKLMHPIEAPLSYSKKWKFKGFWDSYQNNVSEYCQIYFPNEKKIISDIMLEGNQEQQGQRKYTKEMRSIFGMGTNFYQRQVQKIEQMFGIPILSNPQTFQRKPLSQLLTQLKQNFQTLDLSDLEQNPVRQPLLSFLKSKDDQLIMLILHLLSNVINHKYASPEMLDFVCLSTKPKNKDFKSFFDVQQIMKCCFGIMATDPPTFRVCTYKEAALVVEKLSEIFQGQVQKIPEDLVLIAKRALKLAIDRLHPYIYSGNNWDKHLNIFNNVSLQNEKYRRKDLYTFGFLQKDLTEINTLASHEIFSIHPKFPDQAQARQLWVYIIIRDSYCKLMNLQPKYTVKICDQKSQKTAQSFSPSQPYPPIQQDHLIPASYKQLHEKSYSPCHLIFLGGYFVLGANGVIKYKTSYQECLMVMDKSDPSKIMIEIQRKMISIQVENAKRAYELRKYFGEMKNLMFKYQLSMLVKQIQWMLAQATVSIV